MIKNPFVAKTKKEENENVIRAASTLKQLDEIQRLGKDMISDERYKKFKDLLENILGTVLKDLFKYQHPDNNIYAVNVRTILQQLKDLIAFLDSPVNFLNQVAIQRMDLPEDKED